MSRTVRMKKGEPDMTAAMTVGELALGLTAWGLALAAVLLRKKAGAVQLCSLGSLACCAASLCVVVFDFAHLADIEDVSAFLDTADAFRLCSEALLMGTLVLNGLALVSHFWKRDAE